MAWGAVIIGGAAIVGGYLASRSGGKAAASQERAAGSAASAQVYAADLAAQTTREGMAQQERLTAPWRAAGTKALSDLQARISAGPGEFKESPGYQFRLAEGERAIGRQAAARGGLLSGATGKALTRYGQDYATQDYDRHLSRYYQSLAPYQSLAGIGQTTASQMAANVGTGTANLANIQQQSGAATAAGYLGAGQAQAAGYLTQGNIWNQAINQGLSTYMQWKGNQPTAAPSTSYNIGTTNALQGSLQQYQLN